MLEQVGLAAQSAGTALARFIDELQLHRTEERRLRGRTGNARSYAERLFDFPEIGPLAPAAARLAIVKPLADEGVAITNETVDQILELIQGHAYFLQQWGKHTWRAADTSPITIEDVATTSVTAVAALDESFFQVRFDRLTPKAKKYLRAMSELGPGPHHSSDTAFTVPMFDAFMKRIMPGEDGC